MSEEQLIEFLRKNLRLELVSQEGGKYNTPGIEVSIYLGKVCLASDTCTLPSCNSEKY